MAKQAFFNSLQIKAKGAGLPESPSGLCAFFYFQKNRAPGRNSCKK
jgi:hypothetical protein|nr:MAG TPA: hypothetical protein [Caudoviricetes sp.]